jgi:hypothetical protein
MAETDAYTTIEEQLEAVFSVQSAPRMYNEEDICAIHTLDKSEAYS